MTENTPQPQPGLPPIQTHVTCPNCSYNLTGVAIGTNCPECGLAIGRGVFAAAAQLPTSGKAIASLVLGILSIVGCSTYGLVSIPCGILAIYFARGVKAQIVAQQVAVSSEGLARAGFICGIVGLCLGAPFVLLFLLFVVIGIGGPFIW